MAILTKKFFTGLSWLATGMLVRPAVSMDVRKDVSFRFVSASGYSSLDDSA
jgi:hypothetical protein